MDESNIRSINMAVTNSGVAPRACVRVYARVLVPPNLYINTYTHGRAVGGQRAAVTDDGSSAHRQPLSTAS